MIESYSPLAVMLVAQAVRPQVCQDLPCREAYIHFIARRHRCQTKCPEGRIRGIYDIC